jgi:DNA mismatch endonuclease (patch repair protein)
MPDHRTKDIRSRTMSKIRSKNTTPELLLRKQLWNIGRRGYRIHKKNLPGCPDIVFLKKKIAIFVDGCFWHKCPDCYTEPQTNKCYWLPKIQNNVEKDRRGTLALEDMGFKVIRIWEHEIEKFPEAAVSRIIYELDR